jgi:tryptophanase
VRSPRKISTVIEPFRIKSVEPIRMTTPEEREALIQGAGYNVFRLNADAVLLDFLTDSGTGAMSAEQWAGIMRGDESYAGSDSYFRFRDAVRDITGLEHVIPTHQGRAAERILFATVCKPGDVVPNNTHFDTTRANIEFVGATALDLPCSESADLARVSPFKGNIDLEALEQVLAGDDNIPLAMITVTNNSGGGQPVSMANIRAAAEICQRHGVPFYLDACRFAENAYFIQQRESGYEDTPLIDIAREMFSYADGATMSAKKDGMANIGGFLASNDGDLASQERDLLIMTEGFPTYGGLAGRDLDAVAIGLYEALEPDYQKYRTSSTAYLGNHIAEAGVPIVQPPGGHAIYIDAAAMCPHIPTLKYPGISLTVELYREAGIRGVEIGSVMFGYDDPDTGERQPARNELVRLAIPRRVYTQSHVDYAVEAIINVYERREAMRGYEITYEPTFLRHFTARFAPCAGGSGTG